MSAAILPHPPHLVLERAEEPILSASASGVHADLVAEIQSGSHQAMDVLFRAYFPALVRFVRQYVSSIDEAEELVATLFARLWERREHWNPRHTVESYLFAAARNEALNAHRAARRAEQRSLQMRAEYLGTPATAPPPDRDELIEAMRAAVDDALNALPETARVIIQLRWNRQMSYEGIAEVLGGTPASVQRQHSRIIARLRDLVASIAE